MFESNEIIARLPKHLMSLVIDQPYNDYTAQDHAVWRYVMRRNVQYLTKVAHHSYTKGLAMTGIDIDRIPVMYGMNRILKEIGWAAVTVDGFIPPAAFMEFQAYNVLVIAADIRPIDQIEYTPAPDIIHEAAGHAPIIADPDYSEYLRLFGEIGSKAFSSRKDYALYEAIRHLSILKADPATDRDEISRAETQLASIEKEMGQPSEMAFIRNLHWWTVEYGLVGSMEAPRIYGAGLLSSIGESSSCLKPEVRKIPYSLKTKDYSFDITKPQPQLFVTPDFQTLTDVLNEYAGMMGLRTGGLQSINKAIESGNYATCVYDSGLQVSGVFSEVLSDDNLPIYLRTGGPTQLAFNNLELEGHSIAVHKDGFGSPVGSLSGAGIPLSVMSDDELTKLGIKVESIAEIDFMSGVKVQGYVRKVWREAGQIILITLSECTVSYRGEVLFQPAWGIYDMAVGETIVSAYSGLADPDAFGLSYPVPAEKTHKIQYDNYSLQLHELYGRVRKMRENVVDQDELRKVFSYLKIHHPYDWLLALEIYEIANNYGDSLDDLAEEAITYLGLKSDETPDLAHLISGGLELIA